MEKIELTTEKISELIELRSEALVFLRENKTVKPSTEKIKDKQNLVLNVEYIIKTWLESKINQKENEKMQSEAKFIFKNIWGGLMK